jgi:hypothetical protein
VRARGEHGLPAYRVFEEADYAEAGLPGPDAGIAGFGPSAHAGAGAARTAPAGFRRSALRTVLATCCGVAIGFAAITALRVVTARLDGQSPPAAPHAGRGAPVVVRGEPESRGRRSPGTARAPRVRVVRVLRAPEVAVRVRAARPGRASGPVVSNVAPVQPALAAPGAGEREFGFEP